jgi:uncharacterized protein YjbI with pentapeptide repeats
MSKRTMLVELTNSEYISMCKMIPTLETRSHIKISDIRKIQSLPRYSVLDNHILNQYRMDCSNTLSYGERRQLTKLHKGLLEQKLKGYSIIKYFYFPNVDLSNRDLSNITFKDGNLSYGNFKNSNLTNCDFTKTSLREADFTGANLENAKLNINYISNFKCNPINFTGANLKGTILENNN